MSSLLNMEIDFDLFYFYDDINELPVLLWHYTDVNGLLGIVKEKEKMGFRFTRSDCLNDISEGQEILKQYREVCVSMLNSNDISEDFYNVIKDVLPSKKAQFAYIKSNVPNTTFTRLLEYDAYICCFSGKRNSLDMWRYYAKSYSGYSLECSSEIFNKIHYKQMSYGYKFKGLKVLYDDTQKQSLLSEKISQCFKKYQSLGDSVCENIQYNLSNLLYELRFVFKHECFSSEEEYRFVLYLPKSGAVNEFLPPFTLEYRTGNGMIVPYVEIVVDNCRDMLKAIMVSPYVKEISAMDTLESYLCDRNFEKTSIVASTLPVR